VKIAVFLDLYEPLQHTKDGNILLGLMECGAEATLVTKEKAALRNYAPAFPVIQVTSDSFTSAAFWKGIDADLVLAYTWLNRHYNPIVRAINEAGKRLMIRADRDGRIGYPLLPREYYLHPAWTVAGLKNLVRRGVSRVLENRLANETLQQFDLADAIYIESEGARANLGHLLKRWNRSELLGKVHHIPIAVSDAFIESEIPEKKRQVVAVGRWDDWRVKNTYAAVRVLCRLLAKQPDMRVIMLGSGEKRIQQALAKVGSSVSSRFSILGHQSQDEVARILGESMILFMPSRSEAFPLAAGEAVCMGCTVVGGPLEALCSLARGGFSGATATRFDEDALLAVLLRDLENWESGRYDPARIARAWRGEFDRRRVATKIRELARSLAA
jgi:glycosyltransferase involved in cell wall biosynthesis